MGTKNNKLDLLQYRFNCPFYANSCERYSCSDCIKKDAEEDVWLIDGFLTTVSGYPDSVRVRKGEVKPKEESVPIKSNGGSSSYYDFDITNSNGETIKVKCGDVIRCMVGNDFDLGNIIKAARRISEAKHGRGKQGIDAKYDVEKILYFAKEVESRI